MTAENGTASRPVPRLAFWLSLSVPGLGLLYAGAPLRGVAIFALAFLVSAES
jgi:TM2 domain-containing membrane protein YozV